MNKLNGILEYFVEQKGILRLFVRVLDLNSEVKQNQISVLLLEDSAFATHLLHQTLQLGFKESNIVVATKLEGVCNAFESKILKIDKDNLFARLILEFKYAEKGVINALCALDFIKNNGLNVGDSILWHIPESEIMLFLDNKNLQS